MRRGPDPRPASRTRYPVEVQRHLNDLRLAQPELQAAYARVETSIAPLPITACKVTCPNAYDAVRKVLDNTLRAFDDGCGDLDFAFENARNAGLDWREVDAIGTHLDLQAQHDARRAEQMWTDKDRFHRQAETPLENRQAAVKEALPSGGNIDTIDSSKSPIAGRKRRCRVRNEHWAKLRSEGKTEAEIRDTWNAMTQDERAAICPTAANAISKGEPGRDRVKKGILSVKKAGKKS
jgi:hypothetical protein